MRFAECLVLKAFDFAGIQLHPARQNVLKPFVRFENILFGPNSDQHYVDGPGTPVMPVLRPELSILSFRKTIQKGTSRVGKPLTAETMSEHWEMAYSYMDRTRRMEKDAFGAECGSVQYYAYPEVDRIGIIRAGVLLVPRVDEVMVEEYRKKGAHMWAAKPSKKGIFECLSPAFRYPRPLMDFRDHQITARLLEAMGSARLTVWYGQRKKHQT